MRVLDQLATYKERIEERIESYSFGVDSPLSEACFYALKNGGKRFRPAIVYMVGDALGAESVEDAALCVEFFHTASLIADDLPCMDNDAKRRGKPSLHCAFGEQTALLATYALIAAGYELISSSPLAVQQASKNTGILGATGGQYYDLREGAAIERVLYMKTGALFELSFVLGWIFGGGEVSLLEQVRKAAYHFGLAFQIADDMDDFEQDADKPYNFARAFGKEKARERVTLELESTKRALEELGIPDLYQLSNLLCLD